MMDNRRLMYGDIVLTTFKKGLLGVITKVEQDESNENKYIVLIKDGSIVDYIVVIEKDILANIPLEHLKECIDFYSSIKDILVNTHLEYLKECINFYSSIIDYNKEEK